MSSHYQPFNSQLGNVLPPLSTLETNIGLLKPLIDEFNRVVRHLEASRTDNPGFSQVIEPQVLRLTKNFGLACNETAAGGESSSSTDKDAGVVQYLDAAEEWDDTGAKNNTLKEAFGLPYDADDKVVAFYHRQSGKLVPINMRTVRHAVTVKDALGNYPPETYEGGQIVYPIKFTKISFTEEVGAQTPTIETMCPPDADEDAFCLNLYCSELDSYLPEGSDIWVYNVTGQWFTYSMQPFCESSSSKSESSSELSSESSSLSSLSSLSSESSSLSSLSSQSTGSSASSGGSSASSDVSSGGSSESSDVSSGGSSQSSCPPCDGTEISLVTDVVGSFDGGTCVLTLTVTKKRFCFEGVTVTSCG